MSDNLNPITREELFLAKAAGMNVQTPTPITRVEKFLDRIGKTGGNADLSEVYKQLDQLSEAIADLKSTGIIVVQSGDTLTIESVETENVEEVGSDG